MTEDAKHARFGGEREERRIERNRVLTMKYGKQQMVLIRKRMQIENWIEEEVTKLFAGKDDNGIELELDELLGLDTASIRRKFVYDELQKHFCPASMDKITIFLDDLIKQMATL
ncbi:unnamed protein product, partial [Mesorhabditis belari]|uniref:Protein phosphatase 1 regulatory subunit 14B n=1 Tax=Mesorhabditis belari TaxID=2138241 RepID=A0AAF3ETG6_9BILA